MITFEIITFAGAALVGAGMLLLVLVIALAIAFFMDNEENK
jgi:hypothetical protein